MSRSTALAARDAPPGPLTTSGSAVEELVARAHRGQRPLAHRVVSSAHKAELAALSAAALAAVAVPYGATGIAGLLTAACAALLGWHTLETRRRARQSVELNLLAERGALDDAVAAQAQIARGARNHLCRLLATHDLGYYELRRGNLARALQLLSASWRDAPDGRDGRHLRAAAGRNLSTAYLARGDIAAAAAWLPDPAGPDLYTPEVAAALYARRGQWQRVLELEWPQLQSPLDARALRHARRSFHLMRAVALARQGGASTRALTDELEAARPAYAGEYDYLTGQWPELRAFVADRCLAPRSAPDADGLPLARVVHVRP